MKGQKSLEMIIGLIMLLVVASVTISMFLNVFETPDLGQETREKQEIANECSSKCNSWQEASGRNKLSAAVDYCLSKYTRDVNGNGVTSDVAGAGYNSYCEDGVHCFNVQTCDAGVNNVLDAERCRQVMCEYYTKVNNDAYDIDAEQNVQNHIRDLMSPQNEETGVGTCNLADTTDSAGYELSTWYDPRGADYSLSGGEDGYVCEERFERFVDTEGWCEENDHGVTVTDGCVPTEKFGDQVTDYTTKNDNTDVTSVRDRTGSSPCGTGDMDSGNIACDFAASP